MDYKNIQNILNDLKNYWNKNYFNKFIIFIFFFLITQILHFIFDTPNIFFKKSIYDIEFFLKNFLTLNWIFLTYIYMYNLYDFLYIFECYIKIILFGDLQSHSNLIFILNELYNKEFINEYYNHFFIWSDFYLFIKAKITFRYHIFMFFLKNDYIIHMIKYSYINPIFIYFGLFFIITNFFSLFLMSYLGLYGVFFINLFSLFLFWFSSIFYINIFYLDNISFKFNFGKWFIINNNYTINFELLIDSISYSFMLLTLSIAFFVYIYAFSYFRYEPNVERLLIFINFFVISMVCLVTSGNFFVLFLGWELIGLTSFLLINFWSTRISTLKAAFKAFTFNKISDVSLLFSILLIFFINNDVSIINFNNNISIYNNYFIKISNLNFYCIDLISFFIIICAFIKSAQFGFHIWLPDSMEAPVPASALIHSATLVSAGVFILLKLSFMFEYSLFAYYIIPLIGSFTAFFGGLCSAYQSDIKKILAYSTISHCGFLMLCFSTYIQEYTILYLYVHGFFKALTFLCVGNIIRFSRNYQDFRRMGNYWKYLPFECFVTFSCLINLCGLPFTIGFYIKHLIIIGYNFNNYFWLFLYINVFLGAVCGLFYSYKLFYYVFFDFKKSKKIIYNLSNRVDLNSEYYSNTSLASNISILLLYFFSITICLYLFNIFLNCNSLGDGLNQNLLNSSQYYEFNNILINSAYNISYFNWFIILHILIIITFSWRFVFKNFILFNQYSWFILFIIFFSIFYNIL